jgi:hypothetical protein
LTTDKTSGKGTADQITESLTSGEGDASVPDGDR